MLPTLLWQSTYSAGAFTRHKMLINEGQQLRIIEWNNVYKILRIAVYVR